MCIPESARLKIERAQEHYDLLRSRVHEYQALNPFRLIRQPDPQLGISLFQFSIDPPMPAFGILVGEFAHALRSALDHAAVALARTPRDDTSVFFPIFDVDPHKLEISKARRKKLKRWNELFNKFDGKSSETIQALQPYAQDDVDPTRHPLWLVHELDRVDKHQAITPVLPWVRIHVNPESMSPPPYPVGLVVRSDGKVFRPARNGDQIAFGPVDENFEPPFAGELGFGWGEGSVVSLNELRLMSEYIRETAVPMLAGLLPGIKSGAASNLSSDSDPPQIIWYRFEN